MLRLGGICLNHEELLSQKIIETHRLARDLSIEHWLKYELFTWRWWLILVITIIPYIIMWKIVDRKRILEIAVYGLHLNIFSTLLDVLGSELVLWHYGLQLIPTLPALFPYDFSIVPMVHMVMYQRYTKWKDFIIANAIVNAIFAFIAEPALTWLKIYEPISWKYVYSFPIYLTLIIASRWIVEIFKARQQSA